MKRGGYAMKWGVVLLGEGAQSITGSDICNTVSEIMHSNWITPSYYSNPKHKESAS